ncbi:Uncharacterized protein APZ42_024898 [Daphnia magna]|uniref:Uncharacterized protein n=1 Tax=Daphnia magna TaxID=35525 RepID=A0A164TNC4_9CRUS|nr:Uncharacterized protein APZ42_024898 [Daphnia magna]
MSFLLLKAITKLISIRIAFSPYWNAGKRERKDNAQSSIDELLFSSSIISNENIRKTKKEMVAAKSRW